MGLHHSSINFRRCKKSTVLSAHFSQVLCQFFCFWLSYGDMSDFIPKVLIFGHSFVRRLQDDLVKGFDSRAKQNFNLAGSGVYVCLKGIGGRTVEKVMKHDVSSITNFKPDIVILEFGKNDLSYLPPEVVGSRIEELARFCRDMLKIKVVVVCQVINRNKPHSTAPDLAFNNMAAILRQYLCVVLGNEAGIFLLEHRDFSNAVNLLSLDGVHCNSQGQYRLYHSYRGVVLKALNKLHAR